MLNMICMTAQEFADKAKEAGIVILIGIVMVFVILALLIYVIKVLKSVNAWLNSWDEHMIHVRERKGKLKTIRHTNAEEFEHKQFSINEDFATGKITKEQKAEAFLQLKSDKEFAKSEYRKTKLDMNIRYDTAFNVIKEAKFRINKLIKAEKVAFAEKVATLPREKKQDAMQQLKAQRMIDRVALQDAIAIEKQECAKRVAMAKAGQAVPANEHSAQGSKVLDESGELESSVVAAITAAIAVIMSQDSTKNKATFKVRSIKLVK